MTPPLVRCPQCMNPCKQHCVSPTCPWFVCVPCEIYGEPLADRWAYARNAA